MKKFYMIPLLILLILMSIWHYDRPYQIKNAFKDILVTAPSQKVDVGKYGPGLKRLMDLHIQKGYDKPRLSILGDYKNDETIVCITAMKYSDQENTHGNAIASDSTYFRCQFYKVPILNIDILKRVIPEDR